jgi:hypothetical protein
VTYGLWNGDRSRDKSHQVQLPFTLDPVADGFSGADGEYYVVKVAFDDQPAGEVYVEARAAKR